MSIPSGEGLTPDLIRVLGVVWKHKSSQSLLSYQASSSPPLQQIISSSAVWLPCLDQTSTWAWRESKETASKSWSCVEIRLADGARAFSRLRVQQKAQCSHQDRRERCRKTMHVTRSARGTAASTLISLMIGRAESIIGPSSPRTKERHHRTEENRCPIKWAGRWPRARGDALQSKSLEQTQKIPLLCFHRLLLALMDQ